MDMSLHKSQEGIWSFRRYRSFDSVSLLMTAFFSLVRIAERAELSIFIRPDNTISTRHRVIKTDSIYLRSREELKAG